MLLALEVMGASLVVGGEWLCFAVQTLLATGDPFCQPQGGQAHRQAQSMLMLTHSLAIWLL